MITVPGIFEVIFRLNIPQHFSWHNQSGVL
jgi:hypothetical protein